MTDKKEQTRPDERAVYVISVVAEIAGVHPQTLRMYERKGLVEPQRTAGNSRRYSEADVHQLRRIQELTQEGINLAGVRTILDLERQVEELKAKLARANRRVAVAEQQLKQTAVRRGMLVRMSDVRDVFGRR